MARGTQEKVDTHIQQLATALGVGVVGVDDSMNTITSKEGKAKYQTYITADYNATTGGYLLVTYQKGSSSDWHLFGSNRMRSNEFCTMLRNMALSVDYAQRNKK